MKIICKLVIVFVLAVFTMSCNLLNLGQKITSLKTDSTSQSANSTSSNTSGKNKGVTPDGNFTGVKIPTRVKVPEGILNVPYSLTYFESESNYYQTYLVLQDSSIDPMDMITEFDYTITWYDQNQQIIDQFENTYNNRLLPQEKLLFNLWPDKDKVGDKVIAETTFEVTSVTSFKSFADPELMAQLEQFQVKHPMMSISADDYKFGYVTILVDKVPSVSANVTVQSNLTTQVAIQIIGIYLNSTGEMIGVGKSSPLMIDPGKSASFEVNGTELTEEPKDAIYFAEVTSPSDIMEAAYPEMFK